MNNFTPHPIALGPIAPEQIQITVSASNLVLSHNIENRIEELWNIKEEEAKEKQLNFFNGTSYRINAWEYTNSELKLDLAIFDFKHRYGLITMSRQGEIDTTQIVQGGCFVGATVKTVDDQYLMVKQSGKSALNINVYDVLGGMAETDIPCTGGNYFHKVLHQELEEEGGIKKCDISSCDLVMVYAATTGHYGFHFEVTLNQTAAQLIERHQHNTDIDIDSLHAYSREDYIEILQNHPSANKHLMAKHLTRSL